MTEQRPADDSQADKATTANGLPIRKRSTQDAERPQLEITAIDGAQFARLTELLNERPAGFEPELNRLATELADISPGTETHALVLHALGISEPTGGVTTKIGILKGIALPSAGKLAHASGNTGLLLAICVDITKLMATGMKDGQTIAKDWLRQLGSGLRKEIEAKSNNGEETGLDADKVQEIIDACEAALNDAPTSK